MVNERLHRSFACRFVGDFSGRVAFSSDNVRRLVWLLPDLQSRAVRSVVAFEMSEANRLIIPDLIKGERPEMSLTTVLTENQSTHFVAEMIEENHPRRSRPAALNDFSVDDARMLTLLV